MATNVPVTPDTPITIKLSINGSTKKLKVPFRDLGPQVLIDKLRHLLAITPQQEVVFERFSDSAGGYIVLDPSNSHVFKTLIRAAKAKLKLRLKATVTLDPTADGPAEHNEIAGGTEAAPEPVIARTPIYQGSRGSVALDRRSVGSGIFEYLLPEGEAPVPGPFKVSNKELASHGPKRELALRTREATVDIAETTPWTVYCNECDKPMMDAHFHCNVCDSGDFDLCDSCIGAGKHCNSEEHWLIKRVVQDGVITNSTTERVPPRKAIRQEGGQSAVEQEMPGTFTEDTKTLNETIVPTRTCNSCVMILPEHDFVTCTTCDDFDLCVQCHVKTKHGHHPGHAFEPATSETAVGPLAEYLLAPGRNVRHNAICDGCDKTIYGVRYKCLNCPDFDYCFACNQHAHSTHRHHRFAPLYEPLREQRSIAARHFGIYCDGPLCSSDAQQSYIIGVRYKCAVCDDTDFCANCEALPSNKHNRTHPLIKFKTPVAKVSITTMNQDMSGAVRAMGDKRPNVEQTTDSNNGKAASAANVASPVQTVADIKPTKEADDRISSVIDKNQIQDHASLSGQLTAAFLRDGVPDGTIRAPGERFTQVWTIRNPGPLAWPAGCSVRFVGGDNTMLNVDHVHPSHVTDIADASESNVVGREVESGEEIDFCVTMKAPETEGQKISYWRLKTADGQAFGHRLWCDIYVKRPVVDAPAPRNNWSKFNEHIEYYRPALVPPTLHPEADAPGPVLGQDGRNRIALMQHLQQLRSAPSQPQQQTPTAAQAGAAQGSVYPPTCWTQYQERMTQMRQLQAEAQTQAQVQAQTLAERVSAIVCGSVEAEREAHLRHMAETQMAMSAQARAALEHSKVAYDNWTRIRGRHMEALENAQKQGEEISIKLEQQVAVQKQDTSKQASERREHGQENVCNRTADVAARREEAMKRIKFIKEKINAQRAVAAAMVGKQTQNEETKAGASELGSPDNMPAHVPDTEDLHADAVKEEVVAEEPNANELEGSQMIFPTLEKESPASSTYQSLSSIMSTGNKGLAKAAYVEDEATSDIVAKADEVEKPPQTSTADLLKSKVASSCDSQNTSAPVAEDDFDDLTELEVLSAHSDNSEDDGFLTDEEYEILDASDEEFAGAHK
ncbi:hypothetical protein LTR66_006736 [Elasticomyces elasticus]|nr:hypothetical protein LTR66_006736 [Elasticomyces elasticus]